MITEWIKEIENRLNRHFACPLEAGLLEYKGADPTTKAMKEISPMFVTSANKNIEISFEFRVTFMSRIAQKIENIMEYHDLDFKMSDL
jgi:hypothetical protein